MLAVRGICLQLKAVVASIREFDAVLQRLVSRHSEASLFSSFPAMGPVFLARIISIFGSDRKRFPSALSVQTYSGVAPVLQRSGHLCVIRARRACNHYLRQSFVEWAGATIPRSAWACAFYRKLREKNKSHRVAVRALAYKWIRILFACWKNRTPYSEERYTRKIAHLP